MSTGPNSAHREMADHEHVWHRCYNCGAEPIVGARYDCLTCPVGPDNTLCAACFERYRAGAIEHPAPGSTAASDSGPHHLVEVVRASCGNTAAWALVADRTALPPHVPLGFVLRPEFQCGHASFIGSYAFALTDARATSALVITAVHVMDEVAKSAQVDCGIANLAYTGEELPRLINRVHLYDPLLARWMFTDLGSATGMLVIREARSGEQEPYCQRDIAAFVAADSRRLTPGRLAASSPAVGEPIWLAASCAENRSRHTFAATVVECSPEAMIFRFAAAEPGPHRTSGAPLVNERGEVVGINVGGGALNGRRYGHGVHAESISRYLFDSTVHRDGTAG